MRGMRGILIVSSATFGAIGLIQGVIVSVLWHAPPTNALELIALDILVALVWVPVALLVSRVVDATLADSRRAAMLLTLGLASILAETWVAGLTSLAGAPVRGFLPRLVGRSDTNVLFYVAIVGACFAVRARRRQLAAELRAARVQRALAGAQLHVLTLQLHPHFLFNTLNLVSQLAYESVDAAQRAVANLRALLVESLRHALHREVSLADELSFLRAYLEIQQARFRDRLRVTITTTGDVESAAVPHLVLQPIVENAIVHGIAPRATAGTVAISACKSGDRLILTVEDDGSGVPPNKRDGVGLSNTRLRLDQLFGGDHRLTLSRRSPRGTLVDIDIPFRESLESRVDDADEREPPEPHVDIDAAPRRRIPGWLPVIAGWAAVAMMWTEIGALPTPNKAADFNYAATLIAYSLNAGLWILLTPLIVQLFRRFDVATRPTRRVVLVHVVLSLATATLHTGVWLACLFAIRSPVYLQNLRSMFGWAIWDVAAYAAIVAFAAIAMLSSRFRDSRVSIARAQARLASTRVASLRLRLQPSVLLASLDALRRVIAVDAAEAEATIARIGDLLRMLLSRAEREFVSVGEELELLDAFLDVIQSPNSPPRFHADFPRISDVVDELMPAMLLPTLAAAFRGELEITRLDLTAAQLCLTVRSGTAPVDQGAVVECLDRIRRLYENAERASIEFDSPGRTVVELELPRQGEGLPTSSDTYDLATA